MSVRKDKSDSLKKVVSDIKNAGDSSAQVSIFTDRISYLTDHLKQNKKDNSARRGLVKLVSQRKKMLTYIKEKDSNQYEELIQKLSIRK